MRRGFGSCGSGSSLYSEPTGEAGFTGLLLQVKSIRDALGIETTGAMAVLSEANFVMGLTSSGTLPQQAAVLLKALGRAPSPPTNHDTEIIAERVSRARRSKHFLGSTLEEAGTSGQDVPGTTLQLQDVETLHVPKPQRYGKGTNAASVVANEDQLVSLKFLVGPDAQVVVRLTSWDDWSSPATPSTMTALEALHREQAGLASLLEQVQHERDTMRQELLQHRNSLTNTIGPTPGRTGRESPTLRGTDWWAQPSPTAPSLPIELAAKLWQPSSGGQIQFRDKAAKRTASLRSNSKFLRAPRKSRSEVPEAFTLPQKWPKSGAQSWSSPTLAISTLLYEGTLYMVSAHRWGPVEVLRKMNAWVDHATFRCMSSSARVKGLEVPLHLVQAVLPFEQHKRFSICLHDGSVHTFRVVGTHASDSIEKMRAWVGVIGRSSSLLQKQLAADHGTSRGSPNSQAMGDGTAVSLGLFPRAGAMSPVTPPLIASAGRSASPSPPDKAVREITQTPQASASRPKPRRSSSGEFAKAPPVGLPPTSQHTSSGDADRSDSDEDQMLGCCLYPSDAGADEYKRRAGAATAATGTWRELCTYSTPPSTASGGRRGRRQEAPSTLRRLRESAAGPPAPPRSLSSIAGTKARLAEQSMRSLPIFQQKQPTDRKRMRRQSIPLAGTKADLANMKQSMRSVTIPADLSKLTSSDTTMASSSSNIGDAPFSTPGQMLRV